MHNVAFYYCYGHRKEHCSIDVQCFEGEPDDFAEITDDGDLPF